MQVDEVRSTIVAAAERLLRAEGVQAVTTRGVAQAAGVQPPTIYRLFGDKDGLLEALAEHAMATYVAAKAGAAADDPVEDLRLGWRMHVEFGLANPDLYVLLNAPGRFTRSPAALAGIEVLRRRVRRLAEAGLLRVPEERATEMIHAAGTGALLALLSRPAADRDPGLAEAMFEAVAAAILTTAPVTPAAADGAALTIAFATTVADLPGLTGPERSLLAEWLSRSLAN